MTVPTDVRRYQDLLAHVAACRSEREAAEVRQREAEQTFLERVTKDYESGTLSFGDLARTYLQWRKTIGIGHLKRWNEVAPVGGSTIMGRLRNAHKHVPKVVPHTGQPFWSGTWPRRLPADTTPEDYKSVVYILFDGDLRCCYVGSTDQFLVRLQKHAGDGMRFVSWAAYPSRNRAAAYADEEVQIGVRKPYLNKRTKTRRRSGDGSTDPAEPVDQTPILPLPEPMVESTRSSFLSSPPPQWRMLSADPFEEEQRTPRARKPRAATLDPQSRSDPADGA